ncbi:uncharacterized protein PAC_11806 [Phialocephala subalpina]|uniref:Uncharacterized protein n=1 Tax=Phialocephala subalpina TaxID=576137 RepID=A0A1L7XA62_9HELO|nr:uncharacterized protein PAC_11806 [Phialocephala subalpina]
MDPISWKFEHEEAFQAWRLRPDSPDTARYKRQYGIPPYTGPITPPVYQPVQDTITSSREENGNKETKGEEETEEEEAVPAKEGKTWKDKSEYGLYEERVTESEMRAIRFFYNTIPSSTFANTPQGTIKRVRLTYKEFRRLKTHRGAKGKHLTEERSEGVMVARENACDTKEKKMAKEVTKKSGKKYEDVLKEIRGE